MLNSTEKTESEKEQARKEYQFLEGEIEKLNKKLFGMGKKDDGGLYDDQIESVMDNYKKQGFKGVYAIDEINKIPISNKMGVILNIDKSNQPGSQGKFIY